MFRPAILIAIAATGIATPALAGQCPADQVRANPLANHPTMPSMVTDDVIGSVDLQAELGVAGRDLRLRRLVVQPGGVVPFHSHAGRPADHHDQRGHHRISLDLRCRSTIPPATSPARPRASAITGSTTAPSPPSCSAPTSKRATSLPTPADAPLVSNVRSVRPLMERRTPFPQESDYDRTRLDRADARSCFAGRGSALADHRPDRLPHLVDLFATQAILPALARVYGVTPAQIGVAANASTIGMAIAGLVVGGLAQRLDRRRGVWLSLALLAIPTTLLASAPNLTIFALLRVAQGLCMASAFTLTLAYLGERCSKADAAGALAAYVTGGVASNPSAASAPPPWRAIWAPKRPSISSPCSTSPAPLCPMRY